MAGVSISLDEALDLTRTGDVWLFRGRSMADRAIQVSTNSPVNHVGMSVVLDDLPPLMWHAELGRSLPDLWSGTHQRGVQLHDLRSAVLVWCRRYGQQAWLRQLDQTATREMEEAVLRTIARLDGTPFPSTARLASRWLRGRVPRVSGRWPWRSTDRLTGWLPARVPLPRRSPAAPKAAEQEPPGARVAKVVAPNVVARELETAYCAEVIAVTYEAMGLLPTGRRSSWYDAGRFWSGDDLRLSGGAQLSGEIAVDVSSAGMP